MWAKQHSTIIGLQAYLLVTEVLHRNVTASLLNWIRTKERLKEVDMQPILEIESRRVVKVHALRSTRNKNLGRLQFGGDSNNDSLQKGTFSADPQDFQWVENPNPPYCLNEHVVCTFLKNECNPCELSIQLLSRLREIVKSYCHSKNVLTAELTLNEIRIQPGFFDELILNSSYRAFQLQSSKLQLINLQGLSFDERLLFFINMYNLITLHGCILKTPSNSLLSRASFMKECRYNIGEMQFNLMEIEHGILRHSSASCKIAGFDYSISFASSDPRAALVLAPHKRYLSFLSSCLCSAMHTAPAILILKNSSEVENDMKKAFQVFINRNVEVDLQKRCVHLPKVFETFREDFGKDTRSILNFIVSNTEGSDIGRAIKALLFPRNPEAHGQSISIEYSSYDWTLLLILDNK
jgi:hypothetical protein